MELPRIISVDDHMIEPAHLRMLGLGLDLA